MTLPKIKLTGINLLNLVGAIIIVYLMVVLGETVKRNYDLGHQADVLRAQTALLQDQKDQLSYNIRYYNTDSFRQREARSKLGLQLPGENVIIIPRVSPTPTPAPANTKATAKRSNLQQWFDFLGGRSGRS
jgi:cell division protein FtsB